MKIADVMTRDVRVIQPDRTVREAARLMDELNVGALPVCNGRRLIGIVTDRDITLRSTAAGLAPDQSYVREVMTEDVAWCRETDHVDQVVEEMSRLQVRRIPVVDSSMRLVGIVALGDLATDSHEDAARALTRISTPSEPDRDAVPSTARADQTRGGGRSRLTDDERRELDRRMARDGDRQPGPVRRLDPSAYRGPMPEAGEGFRFRDEDHVRAAFGPFGHPGEERARNAPMRGGFGGDGYNNYGEDYGRAARGGAGGGGYRPGQGMGSDLTGRRRRFDHAGDDAFDRGDDNSERERTLLQPNDRSNYGSGPGNTRFGIDAAAGRGEHQGRGPKGYQRSDARIREDISERLTDDALIDASEVEVAVQDREVTLTGTVRTRTEKRRAEDIAESTPGVDHVQNNLRVGQHGAGPAAGAGAAASGNPGIGGAGAPGTTAGGRTGTKGRPRQEA